MKFRWIIPLAILFTDMSGAVSCGGCATERERMMNARKAQLRQT